MPEFELIAACWTTAGACEPLGVDDRSPVPIRDRLEAASRAGFAGFGIRHGDLLDVERELGFGEFRRMLDGNGFAHVELEFLEGWYAAGDERRRSDIQRADLLRAAEALGAIRIKVGGHFAGGPLDVDHVADEFGALAEQARRAGTTVGIEPMPFADVKTPEMALEIVNKVAHPHGGVYIDIWHVTRAGVDVASLASFPVEHIAGVELDDADADVRGTLIEDTFNNRRFPGEGDLDVRGFIDAIKKTGYTGTWGVEMLSTDYRRLPVAEATRRAFDTTAQFFTHDA
jgi:sugar phosphate isomerase/epimerase